MTDQHALGEPAPTLMPHDSDARHARETGPGAAPVLRHRLEGLLGIPATEGNRIDVLRNGDRIFPAMLDDIGAAQRSIDLLTFIYWRGDIAVEVAEALAEKATEGLRVRVLLDAIGGRLIERDLVIRMRSCGVQLEWFRKPWLITPLKQNHRTHRKVLVCDDRVAFTGGAGIAQEWCGDARDSTEWRDTHFRIQGPAVYGVAAGFAQNWAETRRQLTDEGDTFPEQDRPGESVVQVIRGSATVSWNDIATVFRVLIESARRQLRITTAYFNPDETFEELLCAAAARGVEVDVLLPGPYADKRVVQLAGESLYARLVECGVRIWMFQPSMLHTKALTIDGLASAVGSANLNSRSMAYDEEILAAILDPAVTAVLDEHFDDDLRRSERINPRSWSDRSLRQRMGEQASQALDRWF